MKRVIICIVILAVMLTAGISLHILTAATADSLITRLAALERGETADPLAEAQAISAEWEELCAFNIFLTDIEGAAEVSGALSRLAAKARYDADDIAEESRAAAAVVLRYRRGQEPRVENIF